MVTTRLLREKVPNCLFLEGQKDVDVVACFRVLLGGWHKYSGEH